MISAPVVMSDNRWWFLHDSIEPIESSLAARIVDAVNTARKSVVERTIADRVASGTVSQNDFPVDQLDALLNMVFVVGFGKAFDKGIEYGSSAIQRPMRAADPVFEGSFTRDNAEAVRWIDENAAKLVKDVGEETRTAIRTIIKHSFVNHVTPYDTAARLRLVLGLTSRQALALANYYGFLVSIANESELSKTTKDRLRRSGLKPNQIDALSKRGGLSLDRVPAVLEGYRLRLIRDRATTIARTEILGAANAGQRMLWQHAATAGLITSLEYRRKWIITPDEKLCPVCQALDGTTSTLDGTYRGGLVGPPAHPKCRCAEGLVKS